MIPLPADAGALTIDHLDCMIRVATRWGPTSGRLEMIEHAAAHDGPRVALTIDGTRYPVNPAATVTFATAPLPPIVYGVAA